ncbi:MAG: hypothetical protein JSS87_09385 [Acidobacteria bacterium]|nr:hypothetical protein [Acidobacteriota bacterium]
MINGFLLGIIAITSLIAAVFFLKYWKRTEDFLFLAFALAFAIEAVNRTAILFVEHPNEGSPWIYVVRLCAFLIILIAIIRKNYSSSR